MVRNEAARQLRGNEFRGAGMMREQIDDLLAVFHAASVNPFAEHDFRIGIVQTIIELEMGVDARLVNRPGGEGRRPSGDVFLRVSAIATRRVRLHSLTSGIFAY